MELSLPGCQCVLCQCVHRLQATPVPPTCHRPTVGAPGASEPPKKPQRLRQRVEESLSRARQLLRKVIVAGSGSKSRSLPPAFQPPPLSNSSCCWSGAEVELVWRSSVGSLLQPTAQASSETEWGEAVRGGRRWSQIEIGRSWQRGEHECAWIQPAQEGCRHALKGDHIRLVLLRIFWGTNIALLVTFAKWDHFNKSSLSKHIDTSLRTYSAVESRSMPRHNSYLYQRLQHAAVRGGGLFAIAKSFQTHPSAAWLRI